MYLFYNTMVEGGIYALIHHDYSYGVFMPSECVWMVPGTTDPMDG